MNFRERGLEPAKTTIVDQEYNGTTLVSSGIGRAFMIEGDAGAAGGGG